MLLQKVVVVALLVEGSLVFLSPFIGISLVLGHAIGARLGEPGKPIEAGVKSGLVGLVLFWASLIVVMILIADQSMGVPAMAFVLSVVLVVAFAISPIYVALGFFTWNRVRRQGQSSDNLPRPPINRLPRGGTHG
jgi:hypothetical protein